MHVTHPASGVMVTTGIVGSTMPIANGLGAGSADPRREARGDRHFGDGASNIGAFHESLNLASVWKLPVVFICQNNRYAEHTPYADCTSVERIVRPRCRLFHAVIHVDGNDPVAMWQAAGEAVARARNGEGPTLIEAMTFRFHGHIFGDADAYMDAAQKAEAMKQDPVPTVPSMAHRPEATLTRANWRPWRPPFAREVDDAVEFALASPYPDVAELRRDVFAQEIEA